MTKKYYVSLSSGEINQSNTASDWNYAIEATDEEVEKLRMYLDQRASSDWSSFWRSHIPYLEYHHDSQNDMYDKTTVEIYTMLYQLGDNETKSHIKQMNILSSDRME